MPHITELKIFGSQTRKILMCENKCASRFCPVIMFCISLKVVRRTPAIVITLKTTGADHEETKATSEEPSLPIDATVGTTTTSSSSSSSMVQKVPEGSSATVMDTSASEKTPAIATSKRTKKSKSGRKST